MNLQFYIEKLKNSKEFIEFTEKNPSAYLCSGFFTIDLEGNDNQRHLDFYIPEKKEIFSFKLDLGIEKVPVETTPENIPEKIPNNIDFNFEEIEKIITEEMKLQKVDNKLQKIIISFQKHKGKETLFCTVFVSMLGLVKINIDLEKRRVILFEKRSFFDMLKRVK